ncbi:MAG: helix-turn-helix domain-containing protein [Lachnospiraceae bacterium]
MSRRYKYLKYGDRVQIEEKIKEGKDVREIASEIGVHFDTIYKEFRRAGMTKETYDAEAAQKTL